MVSRCSWHSGRRYDQEVSANLIPQWLPSNLPVTSCTCFVLHSAERAVSTSPNWH